ncbi:MAG: hypothetical protein O2894_03340 [Planctomycetota bacterium]|nr:hypothetical protein [Planctomycetota bacterium]
MGGDNPFELEPEAPDAPRPMALPPLDDEPEATGLPESDVETLTVAERTGKARAVGARTELGPPPRWPGEVFTFPLRKPGPSLLVFGVIGWVLLDALGTVEKLQFPAWALKLLLGGYLLRASFHVIGSSAAGRDEAHGWTEASELDSEKLWSYVRTLGLFTALLLPGVLTWVFGSAWLGLLLLIVGSMYAAVVALGAALLDPSLKWPWNALRWMATRPISCLVGSAAWWLFFAAEAMLGSADPDSLSLYVLGSILVRGACMWALLVSARVLGVMGRSWTSA